LNYINNFISSFNKRPVVLITLSIVGVILAIFIANNTVFPVNFTLVISATSKGSNVYDTSLAAAAQDRRSIVPLDQIVNGGPPPDGIPSIDNPKFISVQEAEKFLEVSDLVVGLNNNGDIRAYPLQILVWHEIVNDIVGKIPVAVTYCPLCFTNQVFNRTMNDGQILEFATSGKLYKSKSSNV
jgi:hypothetical protein